MTNYDENKIFSEKIKKLFDWIFEEFKNINKQSMAIILGSVTFIVGFAWRDAINAILDSIPIIKNYGKVAYAIIITILGVIFINTITECKLKILQDTGFCKSQKQTQSKNVTKTLDKGSDNQVKSKPKQQQTKYRR